MTSLTPSSPEKLTISCMLNILSPEDKATLEDTIWKKGAKNLWSAEVSWAMDNGPSRTLIRARTKKEAMNKLLQEGIWDFNEISLWDPTYKQPRFDGNQLPKFTKDMKVEDYWSIIKSFMFDKAGKKIYSVYIPDEYSLERLSDIQFLI